MELGGTIFKELKAKHILSTHFNKGSVKCNSQNERFSWKFCNVTIWLTFLQKLFLRRKAFDVTSDSGIRDRNVENFDENMNFPIFLLIHCLEWHLMISNIWRKFLKRSPTKKRFYWLLEDFSWKEILLNSSIKCWWPGDGLNCFPKLKFCVCG